MASLAIPVGLGMAHRSTRTRVMYARSAADIVTKSISLITCTRLRVEATHLQRLGHALDGDQGGSLADVHVVAPLSLQHLFRGPGHHAIQLLANLLGGPEVLLQILDPLKV